MANRTYLLTTPDARPVSLEAAEAAAWREADYSIPWFWLALFTTDDVVVWPAGDGGPAITHATLVAPRDQALLRLRPRLDRYRRRWPGVLDEVVDGWTVHIERGPGRYVVVQAEELADMYPDPAAWRADLAAWLLPLDDPDDPALSAMLRQSFIDAEPGRAPPSRLTSDLELEIACCGSPMANGAHG